MKAVIARATVAGVVMLSPEMRDPKLSSAVVRRFAWVLSKFSIAALSPVEFSRLATGRDGNRVDIILEAPPDPTAAGAPDSMGSALSGACRPIAADGATGKSSVSELDRIPASA